MIENRYEIELLDVIDGDTVDVNINLGFGIWLRDERVRIVGIDAPRLRTKDKVEKLFGLAAKKRLEELLQHGAILITKEDSQGEDMKGKFGRILGDFLIEDRLVTDILIEEHHCVRYHGENKKDVKLQHLENRKILLKEGVVSQRDYNDARFD